MTKLHLATAFLTALALAPAVATAQTEVAQAATVLSAEDMRVLAQQLLNENRPSDAAQVLNALLKRDPRDPVALILGAQSALDQARPRQAASLARRGYQAAGDDTSRYVAARLAARAHAELGQDTRAQFWLRRARQVSPDAASAASVAQDFTFVRNRNPLSFNLNFGASPSNNINNGSRSDTATIGPFVTVLSESAKPLSGVQFDAAAAVQYRALETQRMQLSLAFDLSTTNYALSQSSKDALQRDIESTIGDTSELPRTGNDFSYTEASFSIIHRWITKPGAMPTTFQLQTGKSWYGGDPYQVFIAPSASHVFALGQTDQLRIDIFARQNVSARKSKADIFGSPVEYPDILNVGAGIGYSSLQPSGDIISLSIARRASISDSTENDFTAWRVGVGFDLAKPVMNIRFGFGVQLEERKYDESFYVDGIRRDRSVNAQVTALFDNVEYYGFSPTVTLGVGRTFSPAERFDTEYATVGMDLRSAF